MHEEFESVLRSGREAYANVPVPAQAEESLRIGVSRARGAKRRRRMMLLPAAAFACLFLAITATIAASPAFAAWASRVPGLAYMVEMIDHDTGLRQAAAHDFIQPLNLSDEHAGIRVSADGLIVDAGRMVVFLTVENGSGRAAALGGVKATDPSGKALSASYTYGAFPDGEMKGIRHTQIDINLSKGETFPDEITLRMQLSDLGEKSESNAPTPAEKMSNVQDDVDGLDRLSRPPLFPGEWTFAIPIDHAKFDRMVTRIPVNRTVEMQGQRITFGTLVIRPTRIDLDAAADPSNTMQAFDFADLKLTDGQGNELSSYGGSGSLEKGETLYFQSSFFDMPKHLILSGRHLRALDRDKMELVVDPETGTIVKAPDGQVKLKGIADKGDHLLLTFEIAPLPEWDKLMYNLVEGDFTDDSGKAYSQYASPKGVGVVSGETGSFGQRIFFRIPKADYQGNLHFRIYNYPSYVEEPFEIRLK